MKHRAHIAHHVKGRMRVKVPSAKGNPEALEAIKRSLGSLTGVHDVTVNPATGSITLAYDPNRHDAFHEHFTGEGDHHQVVHLPSPPKLGHIEETVMTIEEEAEFLAAHSHSARIVFDFVRQVDLGLKKATDNHVDLKVVAPLGLAVYAFIELGVHAATPVWLTLGLFSFNHLVDLHSAHTHQALEAIKRAAAAKKNLEYAA